MSTTTESRLQPEVDEVPVRIRAERRRSAAAMSAPPTARPSPPSIPAAAGTWPKWRRCRRATSTAQSARLRPRSRAGRACRSNERAIWIHRLADEIERRKSIIGEIEALDAGKIRQQAEGDVQSVRRHAALLQQHGRCTCSAARRCRSQGTRPGPCASRGDRAASSSRGTFRSCSSAGASRRRWRRATPWSSSPRKTRRCRRSTSGSSRARSAFPTA